MVADPFASGHAIADTQLGTLNHFAGAGPHRRPFRPFQPAAIHGVGLTRDRFVRIASRSDPIRTQKALIGRHKGAPGVEYSEAITDAGKARLQPSLNTVFDPCGPLSLESMPQFRLAA